MWLPILVVREAWNSQDSGWINYRPVRTELRCHDPVESFCLPDGEILQIWSGLRTFQHQGSVRAGQTTSAVKGFNRHYSFTA